MQSWQWKNKEKSGRIKERYKSSLIFTSAVEDRANLFLFNHSTNNNQQETPSS